jgi:translocation and assembly module TamA
VVSLSPLREEAEQGRVPIEVSVRERVHRSIAAGLEYDTDTGAGAVLMWSHRNLTGRGDRLAAEVDLGTEIRRFSLDYLRDRFLRRDQALDFQFASESEDRDAYDSDRIVLGSTLLRATDRETRKGGVGLRLGATEQLDREWDYAVVSAPLVWRVREVDEPLNPAKGWKVGVTLEPVAGLSGDVASYLKAEAEGAVYVPLDSKARWTLAARLRSGSLLGAPMYDLPADLRYYAGGAGSVRGVPYQEAGPLGGEDDDTPLGGRSLLETVLELRHRLNETMGLVAFVDGGAASLDELPGSGLSLNWGAGLGFRYFTPLGPIRADVAVPLNKRDAVDSRFQVYLSIGHSF